MSDGTYDYDKTMGLFDPMNRAPNAATSPLIVHELRAEVERLRAAINPFMRYLHDIKFNLRKQPRPDDPAIEERGERIAIVTWAEFYTLSDAFKNEAGTHDYDKTMGMFTPKEDLHAEIVRLRDYKRKQAEDIMTLSQMVGKLETEIDWLQAARRRALAIADERSKENVDLRAENERLRKLVDLSATSCSPPR